MSTIRSFAACIRAIGGAHSPMDYLEPTIQQLARRIYSFLIAPAQRQLLSARVIVLPNRFSTASL